MAIGFSALMCKRFAAIPLLAGAACVATLSGCSNKDKDEEVAVASSTAPSPATTVTPRPEALTAAINDIRSGKPADAEPRLSAFLEAEPKSIYAPEAHYLMGQALAAQGEHEDAKKQLEKAIDDTKDRTLKALAMLGRADCNMAMRSYSLASRQYHWLETMFRDVKALPQDELMYKLGLATKNAGSAQTADYWFKQVMELYATGPWYEKAKMEHTAFNPEDPSIAPREYTLKVRTFGSKEKAEAEADILREKGYRDVQVIETTENSNPVYRLHMGKFLNKNDAIRARTDAELAGLNTMIYPPIIEPLK
jgi:TolA-binding protein